MLFDNIQLFSYIELNISIEFIDQNTFYKYSKSICCSKFIKINLLYIFYILMYFHIVLKNVKGRL